LNNQNDHTSKSFPHLKKFLEVHAGIVLKEHQQFHVERKIQPLLEEYKCSTLDALLGVAGRNPLAMKKLISLFTINETSFFRDIKVFNYLVKNIFPEIIKSREPYKELSILSAASSAGQEGYSLAISLYDSFPSIHEWNVTITGVDIDLNMVEKANKGWYSQLEVQRGLPTRSLFKHFQRENRGYLVKPHLKKWVYFRQGNLFKPDVANRKYSMICLRNVLIYFSDADQAKLLRAMHNRLRPGGILLLGASEIGRQIPTDCFERKQEGNIVWYQAIN
jgi:chemotaxis protein methyltransferase CheR